MDEVTRIPGGINTSAHLCRSARRIRAATTLVSKVGGVVQVHLLAHVSGGNPGCEVEVLPASSVEDALKVENEIAVGVS